MLRTNMPNHAEDQVKGYYKIADTFLPLSGFFRDHHTAIVDVMTITVVASEEPRGCIEAITYGTYV